MRYHRLRAAVSVVAILLLVGANRGSSAATSTSPEPPGVRASVPASNLMDRFSIVLAEDKAIVFQGGSTVVRVRVTRRRGFEGAVALDLVGLPDGVLGSPARIGPGASDAELVLMARPDAPHSLPTTVTVVGSTTVAGAIERSSESLTVTVRGGAGSIDTSFSGGSVLTRVGASEDYGRAVAIQADGKVLVAGSIATSQGTRLAVVRYLRDGALDTAFGSGGRVVVPAGEREDVARAIAVQPDGRIVVAGLSYQRRADYDFLVARLLPDGSVDSSFGHQGHVVTDFGGDSDRAFALLVMPDGRIVVGGQTNVQRKTTGVDFALARYLGDGRLDETFGQAGKVVAAILPGNAGDLVRGLALQIVAGSPRVLAVGGEGDFTAARFTAAGELDETFGDKGTVSGLFGVSIGGAHAVTLLPTGEAVVVGHAGHDFAAVQLTLGGRPDPRFGTRGDGRFRHPMSNTNWDEATSVVRQADGHLLLGGWVYSGVGTSGDFGVLRLAAEGTLDLSFGAGGVMTYAVAGAKTDLSHGIVLQTDDRLPAVRAVMAGEAQVANRDFALLRLWL